MKINKLSWAVAYKINKKTQKDGTPGVFGYHFITKEGAKKYSNLPVNNYNNFIEFLAL